MVTFNEKVMDTEVTSFKQILQFSLLSISALIFLTSASLFEKKGSVALCGEQSQMTIVIENEQNEHLLISNASVKNILDCLGRSIPFYERSITYAHIENSSKLADVAKRYQIENASIPKQFGQYVISSKGRNLYSLSHGSKKNLIYTKSPSSFTLIKELKNNSGSVYMPQNSSENQGVFEKMITLTGKRIHEVKNGEFYKRKELL